MFIFTSPNSDLFSVLIPKLHLPSFIYSSQGHHQSGVVGARRIRWCTQEEWHACEVLSALSPGHMLGTCSFSSGGRDIRLSPPSSGLSCACANDGACTALLWSKPPWVIQRSWLQRCTAYTLMFVHTQDGVTSKHRGNTMSCGHWQHPYYNRTILFTGLLFLF